MQYNRQKKQKGFTLVELSIVLVIIGLIISSVLVGQDLIRSAELRSTVTQYEQYNSAIATFRGRFDGIPGDVLGATNFNFTAGTDGNGDEALGTSEQLSGENVFFWNHLGSANAALISGTYGGVPVETDDQDTELPAANLPRARAGQFWGVYATDGINYFIIGASGSTTAGNYTTTAVLQPLDARGIDEKIDDGRPGRGIVQARGAHATDANSGTLNTCASAVSGSGADINNPIIPTAASNYVTTQNTLTCTLRVRFNL